MKYVTSTLLAILFGLSFCSCSDVPRTVSGDNSAGIHHLFIDSAILEVISYCHWEDSALSNPNSIGPTDRIMMIVIKPNSESFYKLMMKHQDSCLKFFDSSNTRSWMPTSVLNALKGIDSCCVLDSKAMLRSNYRSYAIATKDGYLLFVLLSE